MMFVGGLKTGWLVTLKKSQEEEVTQKTELTEGGDSLVSHQSLLGATHTMSLSAPHVRPAPTHW
jgi:hypothetical protein